ncbi:hypothetical protein HMI55_004187 [Coelomomyces lativittatus]|nr:hypothetical protein HMI55_004187 [Coelomomyces lativittatus]
MIENADSKTASIQSASYLGHASSSLCIDLKVQAESSTLPKTDAEKLNNFSIEIASKTKDILLATKMIGKTTSAEAIQVPSNELREKLEELLTYINSSALPIRENQEVSNACKLFVLCQDPERLPINATRIELAMNHLIRSLQRATPGQQEISAATDQILLGINQIDDSLLKCTMKEGLQIKLEHQPQLLSDVANMKDMLQAYNENRSPELALQLATSYFQFTKLATDSGIFELVHKFGDSMIQMLVKKENTDATRLCDELLSVLELRKKFHQIMNQDSEENLKDNPEYDYEHLCSASKSFLTSVSQGDKKVDDYFKILCGAVKRSKLGTNSPKLQNCVDQSFQRVASTALLVLLNGEKPTALSSPISFLIAAVKECTRTSSQCDKAIKEIELLIPVVDTWAAAPVSAITPDTSVISKCGQLNECLNSVMVTVKESDEATFGDAVNSSLIVLKGLLDACSKSKNRVCTRCFYGGLGSIAGCCSLSERDI